VRPLPLEGAAATGIARLSEAAAAITHTIIFFFIFITSGFICSLSA